VVMQGLLTTAVHMDNSTLLLTWLCVNMCYVDRFVSLSGTQGIDMQCWTLDDSTVLLTVCCL
jgi:hypothetical protein